MNKYEIPLLIGVLFRRRSGTIAKIRDVTEKTVTGDIIHKDGYPVPFCVIHNHESFKVGEMVFHFKDWNHS